MQDNCQWHKKSCLRVICFWWQLKIGDLSSMFERCGQLQPKNQQPIYVKFWLTSAQCTFANSALTYLSNSLRHVANWLHVDVPPLSCSLIGTVARRLKDSKTYAIAGLFLSISFLFIFDYFMWISWDHKSEQSLDHDTTLLPWRIFTLINLCQLRYLVC